MSDRLETDEELRERLMGIYGMGGALGTAIAEASDAALDLIAEIHFKAPRILWVEQLYGCSCGQVEAWRAKDNVPPRAHYCGTCVAGLSDDTKRHVVRVGLEAPSTRPCAAPTRC